MLGYFIGLLFSHEDFNKLLLALVLGTAVGIEREFNEKPAGLKTNVLICLGSATFTILSFKVSGPGVDPARIAAQILSGIGFLGAGAIMRDGDRVTGLTTAAIIWIVAAIGMAIGMGHYNVAAMATAGTLVVQLGLGQMDIAMDRLRQRHTFKIVSKPEDRMIEAIGKIFKAHNVRVLDCKVMKKNNLFYSEWWTAGSMKRDELVAHDLLQSDKVIEVTY